MKNIFLSAIALITLGMAATEADAQFYVMENGKVVYESGWLPESERPEFTVTFDSGEGATTVDAQVVKYNEYATKPENPERAGYEFRGWYIGVNNPFNFSQPINGDITLTAKWKEESAGGAYAVATPEAVDLGLPSGTKWATFNIGASAPEEYGDYFAWGETEPHYNEGSSQDSPCYDWRGGYDGYNWESYKFTIDVGSTFTKYTTDGTTELEDADDVATKLLGNDWQMPTYEQQNELRNNCYWVWTDNYKGKSVKGYIVYKVKDVADKGNRGYDGNTDTKGYKVDTDTHIFLPAAGCRYGADLDNAGFCGNYWLRSLYTNESNSKVASILYFYSDKVDAYGSYRNSGLSVRAVQRNE